MKYDENGQKGGEKPLIEIVLKSRIIYNVFIKERKVLFKIEQNWNDVWLQNRFLFHLHII